MLGIGQYYKEDSMKLPLKTVSMRFMLFIAISSLFLSPASAKDAISEDQPAEYKYERQPLSALLVWAHENKCINLIEQLQNVSDQDTEVTISLECSDQPK